MDLKNTKEGNKIIIQCNECESYNYTIYSYILSGDDILKRCHCNNCGNNFDIGNKDLIGRAQK